MRCNCIGEIIIRVLGCTGSETTGHQTVGTSINDSIPIVNGFLIGCFWISTISLITRELSRALDHDDPIPGRYTLEVSSPGLERPLRRPSHFVRAVGQRIKVKTKPHVEGERRLEGVLTTAGDDGIELLLDDGTARALAYDDVERGNTIFVWGPAPKPGKKSTKATATKKAVHA